jgi:hypothetical protein
MGAAEDINGTTGQYNASLGLEGNERSGRAILARQKEGDTGTYHFVDNLARAVRYSTRQIVDLIPKIYDTQRIARVIGEDGESSHIKINPQQPEPVKKIVNEQGIVIEKIFNPGVGKYDVRVVTGPGYATKRMESLDSMSTLLQGNPELWSVAGDLFVKNMDWPGAQEMAKRLAKTIDPKIMGDAEEDPALAAAQQQIQGLMQEMQQMSGMLQNVQNSMEARKLEIDEYKVQTDADIKAYDAETKRLSAVAAGMGPEQVQEIVMQTMRDVMTIGDLVQPMEQRNMPDMQQMPDNQGMEGPLT